MRIFRLVSLAAAFTLLAASQAPAQTATQVGQLSCDVSAGVGLILVQKQTLRCLFTPLNGGQPEPYLGRIDEFGVALGAVGQGHLIWGVLAPASGIPPRRAVRDLRRRRRRGDRRRRPRRERARRRYGTRFLAAARFRRRAGRAQYRRRRHHRDAAYPAAAVNGQAPDQLRRRQSSCKTKAARLDGPLLREAATATRHHDLIPRAADGQWPLRDFDKATWSANRVGRIAPSSPSNSRPA